MQEYAIINKAREDPEIVAVILFGSQARGESSPTSDVDVCLVLRPGSYTPSSLLEKRLTYLKEGEADVHIFSQLPLYIRHRVLKEGKILLCRDEELLYEIAFRTAQAFEDYKYTYYGYLEEVARDGL
ncbi:MAG: type VII toxin-antitoxin system MntA family adenylyltransferase antitoxin [Chloroflexota bacterium]